jgi:hypothetical protein
MGSSAEKVINIFNNISQTKNSVWGLNRAFFSLFEASKKGGRGQKAVKSRVYEVKG